MHANILLMHLLHANNYNRQIYIDQATMGCYMLVRARSVKIGEDNGYRSLANRGAFRIMTCLRSDYSCASTSRGLLYCTIWNLSRILPAFPCRNEEMFRFHN